MKDNVKKLTNYRISFQKNGNTLWEWGAAKRKFIFWTCGAAIILLALFFCIFAFTPLKKLMPGYPTHAELREAARKDAKLDSLDNQINLWRQQLRNIQLITSGQEPVVIRSDSAYIEQIDAANAELWEQSERQLKEIVENGEMENEE